MQKHLIRPCPSCTHATAEILHPTAFVLIDAVPLVRSYDVVTCEACGFAFADTASTQADYDSYYRMHSKYEDATTATGSDLSPADAQRMVLMAQHIASLVPDRATRIADIGCANGGLLAALHAIGYTDLTGIDPSAACARTVDGRAGICGLHGSLFQLPAVEKPFDLILMTGVLEHVRDIGTATRNLATILAPEGYLYLTVPDASRYQELLYAPFQEFNIEHINHFTVASLSNFMQRQSYRCLATGQQTYEENAGSESPAVFGLFQRTAEQLAQPAPDTQARVALLAYIADSRTIMQGLEQQLAQFFAQHPKVIVWGTGQLALKLLALPPVNHAQIVAFVDGNPINQGETLLGKTILSPLQAAALQEPILLTTTLHHAAISRTIRTDLQMQNTILTLTVPPPKNRLGITPNSNASPKTRQTAS